MTTVTMTSEEDDDDFFRNDPYGDDGDGDGR